METKLVTVTEAALACGVSRSLMWVLVMRGEIRSIVISKRARRIPVEAIDEFVARQLREQQEGADTAPGLD
jgi:excisionase family DNA binding protein